MFKIKTHNFAVAYFWRGENTPSCMSQVRVTNRWPTWAYVLWCVYQDMKDLESGVREIQIRMGLPESGYKLTDFNRQPPAHELAHHRD
jgi:hypothetical protein